MMQRPSTTWFLTLILPILGLNSGHAVEVQHHGVWFERWLCDTFFQGYRATDYTQKWDIPASVNEHHGGLPVNPKAVKFGAPVGLGDALRQFDIKEPFLLVVGFWEQTEPSVKRWVNLQSIKVTPDQWQRLWAPLTRADLEQLDAIIKDPSLSLEQARAKAQALKSQPPYSRAIITLNPKIDSRQRRLQCSLSFKAFFAHLAPSSTPVRLPQPQLWGQPIPQVTGSRPRSFDAP